MESLDPDAFLGPLTTDELALVLLARLASREPFSPCSSLYFKIFLLSSFHALFNAVLSYSENAFGSCFREAVAVVVGGGRGDRGSSMGTGEV
jgi:hypothetical protein